MTPSNKNAPFLAHIEVKTEAKNTKQKMLYTSLNFGDYATDFNPAFSRLKSTLPLFRNNTPVPLFHSCMRTAQHYKRDLFC